MSQLHSTPFFFREFIPLVMSAFTSCRVINMHLKHTVFLLADFIFNNTEQEVTLDLQDK